jgi:hypothetical protein
MISSVFSQRIAWNVTCEPGHAFTGTPTQLMTRRRFGDVPVTIDTGADKYADIGKTVL